MDYSTAAQRFDPNRKLAFLTNVAIAAKIPDVWQQFFAGTFVLGGHLRSESPLIAFYNPFFDAALFTVWVSHSRTPHLTDAWFVVDPYSIHLERDATPPNRVVLNPFEIPKRVGTFSKWFEQKHEPLTSTRPSVRDTSVEAFDILNKRLVAAQLQMAGFERLDQTLPDSPWQLIHKALAVGDSTAISKSIPTNAAVSAETLMNLPALVRKSFEPQFVVGAKDRLLLFSWNPAIPRFVLVTDYRIDKTWVLSNADILLVQP